MMLFNYSESPLLHEALGIKEFELDRAIANSRVIMNGLIDKKSDEIVKMLVLKLGGMTIDEISLHVFLMMTTMMQFCSDKAVMKRAKEKIAAEQLKKDKLTATDGIMSGIVD